jgi:hypothetical protein
MVERPEPQVGQVVDHYFLWADEKAAGNLEGRKPRPCLIISVEHRRDAPPRVTVLPITSQPPRAEVTAVAIPDDAKVHIGLDRARPAWVIVDDANVFAWPGYDLVPQRGGGFIRGVVSRGLFARIRDAVLSVHSRNRPRIVRRDDT